MARDGKGPSLWGTHTHLQLTIVPFQIFHPGLLLFEKALVLLYFVFLGHGLRRLARKQALTQTHQHTDWNGASLLFLSLSLREKRFAQEQRLSGSGAETEP